MMRKIIYRFILVKGHLIYYKSTKLRYKNVCIRVGIFEDDLSKERIHLLHKNIEVPSKDTYPIMSIAWDDFDDDIEEYYGLK